MKKLNILLPSLLGAAVLLLGAGCATNQDSPATDNSVKRVQSISKLAAYSGTLFELIRSPQSRPALEEVRAGVNDLVAQEEWDMTALVLIAGGRFPELQSDEGLLVLGAAPMLTDIFTGIEYDLSDSKYAKATITGIAQGMELALGPKVTVTRSGPTPLPTPPPPAHGVIEKLQAEVRATR